MPVTPRRVTDSLSLIRLSLIPHCHTVSASARSLKSDAPAEFDKSFTASLLSSHALSKDYNARGETRRSRINAPKIAAEVHQEAAALHLAAGNKALAAAHAAVAGFHIEQVAILPASTPERI